MLQLPLLLSIAVFRIDATFSFLAFEHLNIVLLLLLSMLDLSNSCGGFVGRCSSLMVLSALDSGSSGLGLSLARGTVLHSWARHLTFTVPISTQVYKWVPANLNAGVTLQWTSIPSIGEYKYF